MTVYWWAWTQSEEQSTYQYGRGGDIWRIATQTTRHQRNKNMFGSERAQSKHQCPVHLWTQWHNLTLKLNRTNHINYVSTLCPEHTKCTTFSRKPMLGKTSCGEFKLLRIRELDNDDVVGKPDSTDEVTPPNFRIGQGVMLQCEGDIGCIRWNTSQCDAKSVVYGKRNFFSYQCSGHGPFSTA